MHLDVEHFLKGDREASSRAMLPFSITPNSGSWGITSAFGPRLPVPTFPCSMKHMKEDMCLHRCLPHHPSSNVGEMWEARIF